MPRASDLKLGDLVYDERGAEVGIVIGNSANEITIDLSRHTPIRKAFRLDKARLDLKRHTLPIPITDMRGRLNSNVFLLDPVS